MLLLLWNVFHENTTKFLHSHQFLSDKVSYYFQSPKKFRIIIIRSSILSKKPCFTIILYRKIYFRFIYVRCLSHIKVKCYKLWHHPNKRFGIILYRVLMKSGLPMIPHSSLVLSFVKKGVYYFYCMCWKSLYVAFL